MAISYSIDQHIVAFPSHALATNYAAHIFNLELLEDTDNGMFIGKGEFVELDHYKEAAPTSFSGTVLGKAANGHWYVEVVSATNAYFVYQVPMIEEEYNNNFKKESNYYNASGTVVRAYELTAGDVIEISENGFTATPAAKDSVSLQAASGKTYAKMLGKS